MKNAIEIVNGILEEELDVIAEGKRNIVAQRIVSELHIDNMRIATLDEIAKEHSSVKPPVNE